MVRHSEFILTPSTRILDEAGVAIGSLSQGIESYPLREYFLQSVFLRLTGAQEQKCKCILWDVATYDYGFRHQNFGGRSEIIRGECSTLKEKNNIYTALLRLLNPDDDGIKVNGFCDNEKRKYFIDKARRCVLSFYHFCSRQGWPEKEYNDFDFFCQKLKYLIYIKILQS